MASGVPASVTMVYGARSQARRVDGEPAVVRRPQEGSAAPDRRSTRASSYP